MSAPTSGHQVPQREDRQPGGPEAEPGGRGLGLGDGDGGGLVDGELGGRGPPAPADAEQAGDLQAVEAVADAEQGRGGDGGDPGAAGGDDPDEGELRAAGEQQRRQRHRLPEREPGRDGQRAEADAVGAGRHADATGSGAGRPAGGPRRRRLGRRGRVRRGRPRSRRGEVGDQSDLTHDGAVGADDPVAVGAVGGEARGHQERAGAPRRRAAPSRSAGRTAARAGCRRRR